jgi:hypothetical protein
MSAQKGNATKCSTYLILAEDGVFRVSEGSPTWVDHGLRSCHDTMVSFWDGGVCPGCFIYFTHDAGADKHLAEAQSAVSSVMRWTSSHVAPGVLVGLRGYVREINA